MGPWGSRCSGSRSGTAGNGVKQGMSHPWALVFPSVKWGGWAASYLRAFSTLRNDRWKNYSGPCEGGIVHGPHPFSSVFTVHGWTKPATHWGSLVTVGHPQDHTGLHSGLPAASSRCTAVLANGVAVPTESRAHLLSQTGLPGDHHPPGPPECVPRIRIVTLLRQTNDGPRSKLAGGGQARLSP